MDNVLTIDIVYHELGLEEIEKISVGDWIDLRAAETVELEKGQSTLISLGVSMRLPEGYEANIVPRSSTLSKYGVLQGNHFAVIDNSYSGTNDVWKFSAYAVRDTTIFKNERICQFRLNKVQPKVAFNVVFSLDREDRGGFGSTGSK